MNLPPVLIAELANFHGGSIECVWKILDVLKQFPYEPKAVKFQPFKYDQIAMPDYEWYPVYEKLFIGPDRWAEIIKRAKNQVGNVWLDLFDLYGTRILAENRSSISGIKLQASVLDNDEVWESLSSQSLSEIKLMLNISGYSCHEIEMFVDRFKTLRSSELILQIGYQRYPTEIEDAALNKIGVLKQKYNEIPLCFADHVSAEDSFSRRIPLVAAAMGCKYIEKHICLSRKDAKYDHYSSLEPAEFIEMSSDLQKLARAVSGDFISASEMDYLAKSIQVPVLKQDLPSGALVSRKEVLFRRTAQKGLPLSVLEKIQNERHILTHSIKGGKTLQADDFSPANIAVIVACRMKSSRLKQKAILPIAGIPSVERCLQNCLMIPHADNVILATSIVDEDAVLEQYTLGGKVKFWRGDPDDVIMRYLGACDAFGVDVIIRVTADCPVVSPEIAEYLLKAHFESKADYTAPNKYAVGSNCEIYNVSALKRVIDLLGKAEYSEYMTWYMRNNSDVFKVNIVDLPEELVRNYRLTLDYPEDLDMFTRLYLELEKRGQLPYLKNVYGVLDSIPEIASINNHLVLKYRTDQSLIDKLNRVTRIKVDR